MKFKNLCLLTVILTSTFFVKHVVSHLSSETEDEFIRNLFMRNLEEDYREFSNEKLTSEIAGTISNRYKSFRESRVRPHERTRNKRETFEQGEFFDEK